MRRVLVVLLGCVAVASSGCDAEHVSIHWDDLTPRRRAVYVEDHHVCTNLCHDHYWSGSRVVVLSGHRHHSGCGHIFRGGHWIVVTDHDDYGHVAGTHHCDYDCHHHYWDGVRLVVLNDHRHGSGCGHVFSKNRWVLAKSRSHKARIVRPNRAKVFKKGKAAARSKVKVKKERATKGKATSQKARQKKGKSKKSRSRRDRD